MHVRDVLEDVQDDDHVEMTLREEDALHVNRVLHKHVIRRRRRHEKVAGDILDRRIVGESKAAGERGLRRNVKHTQGACPERVSRAPHISMRHSREVVGIRLKVRAEKAVTLDGAIGARAWRFGPFSARGLALCHDGAHAWTPELSRRALVVDEGAGGKGTKHCRAFLVEGNAVETAAESAAAERDAESDLERSAERDAVPGVWLKTTRTAHVSEPSMAHRTATIGSFELDAGDRRPPSQRLLL